MDEPALVKKQALSYNKKQCYRVVYNKRLAPKRVSGTQSDIGNVCAQIVIMISIYLVILH